MVIGIFGDHMMRSTVYRFKVALQRNDFPRNGHGHHFISTAAIERLFRRFSVRLTYFTSENSGFQLTAKYANHLCNVCLYGNGTFTAGRIEYLMVVMMFALRDLAFREVKFLNDKIAAARPGTPWYNLAKVVDPWAEVARAFIVFLEYFLPVRSLATCETAIPEIAKRGDILQRTLLEVFPEKSGAVMYIQQYNNVLSCILNAYFSILCCIYFALTFVVMHLCRRGISLEFQQIPHHGKAPHSVYSHVWHT